jgi:hypothetical protein
MISGLIKNGMAAGYLVAILRRLLFLFRIGSGKTEEFLRHK